MRGLRLTEFSLLAIQEAFHWCSRHGAFARAAEAASLAGPKALTRGAIRAWAAASLPVMLAGLAGPLRGRADQVAEGLCGFPERQDLAKALALMGLGAFGESSKEMHSQRWATMLRSGATRWAFADSLIAIGAIKWSLMVPGQAQSATRLALGLAKQGVLASSPMARSQVKFLRRACLSDPAAAHQEMAKAWKSASMPEGSFDEFWSARVEPSILSAQCRESQVRRSTRL